MHGHAYNDQRSIATHLVKTEYGTFRLCPACINAGHAGVRRAPERVSHILIGAGDSQRCDCEHVSHMSKE